MRQRRKTPFDSRVERLLVDVERLADRLIKPVEGPIGLTLLRSDTQFQGLGMFAASLQAANLFVDSYVIEEASECGHGCVPFAFKRNVIQFADQVAGTLHFPAVPGSLEDVAPPSGTS